ncbi:MAG: PKD domain-containing protein, partial [Thermoplasmata archaeon]|nr:PKD domain-containing protein [Thermoplasmata archaeon]
LAVFLLVPLASAHTDPPGSGNWVVSDDTYISNRTIDLNGDLRVNAGGNLTLRNVTLNINSGGQPSGVIVNEGGYLAATDLDGDPSTTSDRSVISATSASSRTFLQAREGSSIALSGVSFKRMGLRFKEVTDPFLYFGVHIATSDAVIRDVTIEDTYFGLLLQGITGVHVDGLAVTGMERRALYMNSSTEVMISRLTATGGPEEEALVFIDNSSAIRFIEPVLATSDDGGIKMENSLGLEVWNATFEGDSIEISAIRSSVSIFNHDPAAGRTWVSPSSVIDVYRTPRFRVIRLEGFDRPLEGAEIECIEMQPQSIATGVNGMTDTARVRIAGYEGTGIRVATGAIVTVSYEEWAFSTPYQENWDDVITFYEGQGVPYFVDSDATSVEAVTSTAVPLTVLVEDIVHAPVENGSVMFIITEGASSMSFSPTIGDVELEATVTRGVATVELHLGADTMTGIVVCSTPDDEVLFMVTTFDIHARLRHAVAGRPDRPLRIDASASSGDGLTYFFDFGDGTVSGWTEDPVVTHPFGIVGEYTVTLKVRDSNGLEDLTTSTVVVKAAEPGDALVLIWMGVCIVVLGGTLLAWTAVHQRRTGRARAEVPQVESQPPDRTRMAVKWYDRGTSLATRDEDEAMKCLEKALQLNPTFARAYHNLGILLLSRGDISGAREMFLNSLENDPGMKESERALKALGHRIDSRVAEDEGNNGV